MPDLLLTILVSAAVSAIFSAAAVIFVRHRLVGQFADIAGKFRKIREVLRAFDNAVDQSGPIASRLGRIERSARRSAVALARFQQANARRLTPLLPLSRELATTPWRRDLSEREVHALADEWAPRFGLEVGEADLRWILRRLRRLEAQWPDDVPLATIDAVAAALAILAAPQPALRLVDAGSPDALISLFLVRVAADFFPETGLTRLPSPPAADTPFSARPRVDAARLAADRARVAGVEAGGFCVGLPEASSAHAVLLWGPAIERIDLTAALAAVMPAGVVLVAGAENPPELSGWAIDARLGGIFMYRRSS